MQICPKLIDGINCWLFFKEQPGNPATYIVGNEKLDRYITVPSAKLPIVQKALKMFDGEASLATVATYFLETEHKQVDVAGLYGRLENAGLLQQPGSPDSSTGDIQKASVTLFDINLERITFPLNRIASAAYTWGFVVTTLLIVVGSALVLRDPHVLGFSSETVNRSIRFADAGMIGMILASFFLHELAHGLVATHYGLHAKHLRVSFYLGFIPLISLRVPGLYTLKPAIRIKVFLAGVYTNFALASLCIIGLNTISQASPWYRPLQATAMMNYLIALLNLFPFLPSDGYYLFTTLFRQVNLRSRSWREFKNWITFRDHRFSGMLAVYFACTAGVSIFLMWRNILWLSSAFRAHQPRAYVHMLLLVLTIAAVLIKLLAERRPGSARDRRQT